MLTGVRSRLTFANVCSFLALTIAIGTGGAYAADTVFSTDIVDGEVKTADIGNNQVASVDVRDDSLANGGLGSADLGPDSVGGSEIAAGAVDSAKVADESLTSSELGTNSVNATEVADDAIDSGEIADNSLFSPDLAGNSVTASEIAPSAVTSGDVANNTLTTDDILGASANGSVNLSGVPNGRCSQVTLNVSGAQVGQVPVVATNASIQSGVFLYAMRVEAAGQVEASICNFSGGAMTPIVGMPVRVITFG